MGDPASAIDAEELDWQIVDDVVWSSPITVAGGRPGLPDNWQPTLCPREEQPDVDEHISHGTRLGLSQHREQHFEAASRPPSAQRSDPAEDQHLPVASPAVAQRDRQEDQKQSQQQQQGQQASPPDPPSSSASSSLLSSLPPIVTRTAGHANSSSSSGTAPAAFHRQPMPAPPSQGPAVLVPYGFETRSAAPEALSHGTQPSSSSSYSVQQLDVQSPLMYSASDSSTEAAGAAAAEAAAHACLASESPFSTCFEVADVGPQTAALPSPSSSSLLIPTSAMAAPSAAVVPAAVPAAPVADQSPRVQEQSSSLPDARRTGSLPTKLTSDTAPSPAAAPAPAAPAPPESAAAAAPPPEAPPTDAAWAGSPQVAGAIQGTAAQTQTQSAPPTNAAGAGGLWVARRHRQDGVAGGAGGDGDEEDSSSPCVEGVEDQRGAPPCTLQPKVTAESEKGRRRQQQEEEEEAGGRAQLEGDGKSGAEQGRSGGQERAGKDGGGKGGHKRTLHPLSVFMPWIVLGTLLACILGNQLLKHHRKGAGGGTSSSSSSSGSSQTAPFTGGPVGVGIVASGGGLGGQGCSMAASTAAGQDPFSGAQGGLVGSAGILGAEERGSLAGVRA